MDQKKMCYIILVTLSSILLEDVFAASPNQGDDTLECGTPSGKASIRTTCCADLEGADSNSYRMCATLTNTNGNLNVTGNLQSVGVVLHTVIDSNGFICTAINSDQEEEACINVISRNASEICFSLLVRYHSGPSKSSPVCLSLPSLKTTKTKGTGSSENDFFNGFNKVFNKIGNSKN